ncbi:MAG TPA: chemotaxis protein CheB [Capillimicrobium sp.]|nr:chemotaxis protein CheB [Capillimicrobium sp.]
MAADDQHAIVVIGASAGGVESLTQLVRDLPAELPAAVAVVLHLPPSATSVLPSILNRSGALPALAATDGEAVAPGRIYVAPPDHHLIVGPGELTLSHGPTENGHRPAIDTTFRTAALSYGPRAIGVVLSGTLDDGAAGLAVIKDHGGTTVVQTPDDAAYRGMPEAALAATEVDRVLPVRAIGAELVRLTGGPEPLPASPGPPPDPLPESAMPDDTATGLICPECGGALWSLEESGVHRFRCRIGHAFSEEALLDLQGGDVEAALWTALRALEERSALLRRMAERARTGGSGGIAAGFLDKALDIERQAEIVRAGVLPLSVHVVPDEENLAS